MANAILVLKYRLTFDPIAAGYVRRAKSSQSAERGGRVTAGHEAHGGIGEADVARRHPPVPMDSSPRHLS